MKEKIIAFFTDIVKEMGKVTWPKKEELRSSTVIVLIACVLISIFVYVSDTIVDGALRWLIEQL
ncbi:MAG TPA: preprotein translocase subunit SecE [Bacteroidota bacterium]|jgi:preprotein translocase subunit SecE